MPLTYSVYYDSTHIQAKWFAEALGEGKGGRWRGWSIFKNFSCFLITKSGFFHQNQVCLIKKKSKNKLIAIYGRLKAEDLKRNSWVSKNLILATFMSKLTLQLSEVLLHFIKDNTPFNFTYYMIVYKNCMRY